jgi:CubicO group peptidase (beta-lactamase class C family)
LAVLAACGSHDAAAPPPAPAPAPAPKPAAPPDVRAQVEKIRAEHHLPALGLAVWQHGELAASAVVGERKQGDAAHPATFADRWHLGSDTKAMTATLVGIYVERGALHWDDTLAKLFPDRKLDPGYRAVTLDQLLQHRGGAPGDPP